ncbi:hypothetical protein NCLIV_025690 [Neospora caninum Liverpool]|uniref:SF4 helicase domain-containing protein n=1 Tax=Neospora caninum (strain Liverpool) TaxID=572307 RepID=F0VGD7_NEOCL|nr:hypothetical protein NCLIV_025690 [Neospora caninum Liverpool]CBZ52781.1 hypothetical protein NCLIV_025690 [Neospora caninum Liverpool]|eukprot:XP_003882813.1 hypothetical protein NCLIV_025690 [Neospora caninum Liverpool]
MSDASSRSGACFAVSNSASPSTFVSAYSTIHNAASLSAYLLRKRLEFVEHPNKFTLKFCPNCPDHKHRRDNLFKLEVFKNSGNCYCHRCGWKGSFFDLKTKLGDLNPQDVLAALQATGGGPRGCTYTPGPWEEVQRSPNGFTDSGAPGGGFLGSGIGSSFSFGSPSRGFEGALGADGRIPPVLGWGQEQPNGDRYHPRFESFAENLESAAATRREKGGEPPTESNSKKTRTRKATSETEGSNSEAHSQDHEDRDGCGQRVLQYLTDKRGMTLETLRAYGVGCVSLYFPPLDASAKGPPPKWESHDCVTFPWQVCSDPSQSASTEAEVAAAFERQPSCSRPVSARTRLLRSRGASQISSERDGSGAEPSAPTASIVRVKARSITEKSCMRLLPAGGQWGLFGAGTVPAEADTVVVTEGEFDAMSVFQQTGLPAVSVPMGAHSLPVQVLPFFERFKKIILWMDEDAAGREGAELFASKLGIGRCYLVRGSVVFDALLRAGSECLASAESTRGEETGERKRRKAAKDGKQKREDEAKEQPRDGDGVALAAEEGREDPGPQDAQACGLPDLRGGVPKDANEALLRGFDLRLFIDSAAPIPHSQILTFRDLRNSVFDEVMNPGRVRGVPSVTLPAFTRLLGGLRRGELSVWTGGTGMGKTTILSQLSIDFCLQGLPTLWGSFEVNNVRLLKTMLRQFSGGELDGDRARFDFFADKFASLPLYFLKFHGSTDVDEASAREKAREAHPQLRPTRACSALEPLVKSVQRHAEELVEFCEAPQAVRDARSRRATTAPLHVPAVSRSLWEGPCPPRWSFLARVCDGNGRLRGGFGIAQNAEVIDAMDYACYVLDVGHVILDNLQFMLSGQARGHEVWDMQNSAIEKFRRFATTKNVHISIVVHPRKEDDDTPLGLSSVFGSVKSTQEADNVVILQRRRRSPTGHAATASRSGSRRGGAGLEGSASPPGDSARTTNYLELRKNRFSGELGNVPYVFNKNSLTIRELSTSQVDAEDEAALRAALSPPDGECRSSRKRAKGADRPDAFPREELDSGSPGLPEGEASSLDLDSAGPAVMAHAFDQLQRQWTDSQARGTELRSLLAPKRGSGGFSGSSSCQRTAGPYAFQVSAPGVAPRTSTATSGLLQHSPSTPGSFSSVPGPPQSPANALHAAPASAAPPGSLSLRSPSSPVPPQPAATAQISVASEKLQDLVSAPEDPAPQSSAALSTASGDTAAPRTPVRSQPAFVLSPESPMPLLRELASALPLAEPVKLSGPSRTKAAVYEDLRRVIEKHPQMKRIAAAVVKDFEKKQKEKAERVKSGKDSGAANAPASDASGGEGDARGSAGTSSQNGGSGGREPRSPPGPDGGASLSLDDAPGLRLTLRQDGEEEAENPVVKLVPAQEVLGPVPPGDSFLGESAEGAARRPGTGDATHVHGDACRLQVAQPVEPPSDYIRSDFILVDSACKMQQLAPYLYRILQTLHPNDARYTAGGAPSQAETGEGPGGDAETAGAAWDRGRGPSPRTDSSGERNEESGVCLSMGVDVETTGLDPYSARVRLLQLALPDFPTLLFDLFALPVSSPSLRAVRLLLASPRIRKVFHNGKFDLCFLAAAGLGGPQSRPAPRTAEPNEALGKPERSPPEGDVASAERPPGGGATRPKAGTETPGASEGAAEQEATPTQSAAAEAHAVPLLDAAVLGERPEIGALQSDGGVYVSGPIFDTLIAAKVVEAGVMGTGFKLLQVVERFLGVLMDKRMQASDWSSPHLSQEQLLYAARDAAVMLPLQQRLQRKLEAYDLQEVMDVEMRCLRPVVAMELNGMQIEHARWKELEAHLRKEEVKARKRLAAELHVDETTVNFNSQKQMLDALRAIGIPSPPPDRPASRSRGARPSAFSEQRGLGFDQPAELEDTLLKDTSDGTLARLTQYPAVQALRDYRKAAKAITTFVDKLPQHINSVTGKIHCSLHQCGAGSGRFSCDSPNLQQIPRERRFRACFVPSAKVAGRPGKFIIADFSQIELRIAADLACDERMIEAYQKGEDLHKLTASLILNKPASTLSKADRQLAKAVNFGLIYGMSADRFRGYASSAYGVQMTPQEARAFHAKYFSSYAGITRWHQRQKAEQPRETRTRAGRRALFDYFAFTKSLNYPIQGTSADITKESLVRLQDKLAPLGGRLVMCVHDEIIAEVPEDKAEEGLRILIETMEAAGNKFLRFVPCVAEGAIADSWADKP